MSFPFFPTPLLSREEREELNALRLAISEAPFAVVPEKQERFTFLFAKSIAGKGDLPLK